MKNIILKNDDLELKGIVKILDGKSRGVSDCGILRINTNDGYDSFNIPPLYNIDDNLYDELKNSFITKRVGKVNLNSSINIGYKDSYTKQFELVNGEFVFTIKYAQNIKKNGKILIYSDYVNSYSINQWGEIQIKLNPYFFDGFIEEIITIEDFKNFLNDNAEKTFDIYYELSEEEHYKLETQTIVFKVNDDEEVLCKIIDPIVEMPILNKYGNINFKETEIKEDIQYASDFGCSCSSVKGFCSGEKNTNKIVVKDLYYLDFEVGQGIAIENACYIREKELSWLCAEIKDIDYSNNIITISRDLQETVDDVNVEHDNFIPYLKITNYYINKDFVSLKFEPGTYLNHALRSVQDKNTLKNILSEHNLARPTVGDDRCIINITNKRFIDIDFQGSMFKEVSKWQLKVDGNFGGARCSVLPYSFIQLYGCDKVVMKNGKIDHDSENNCIYTGVRTAENMGNGFCIHGCRDILLENLEAYGCESDGFALGGSTTNFYNKSDRGNQHILLRNCKAYYCGRQGLTFSSGTDGVIDNCDFSYTGFCKDGVTKCWWGNRNPGAGIDFEFESSSDTTTGWSATSAIRRIKVVNTKLIGNAYTLANGMTEGNFLMENCVLIGNPNGVFLIKTGNNAGFTMRESEDEGENYEFGSMQPITCIFRDCLIDHNGVPNKSGFGYFRRVIIDNCVLKNFFYDYSGRQFSIINSDLQYTDGAKAHMQGYPRFPLIQNCTIRFRRGFIDKWESSNQWAWSPIYGQFQDCVFYLEEPTTNYTDSKSRNLIVDFGKNSTRNYVYPAKNYELVSSKNNPIIKEKTTDWGDRECYEVYSKDDFFISRVYRENVILTQNATITSDVKSNFIISPNFMFVDVYSKNSANICFRGSVIDHTITIPANRSDDLKKIYMYFWSSKAFKFSDGSTKFTYVIPEEYKGKEIILGIKQDYFDELLVNIKLSLNEIII